METMLGLTFGMDLLVSGETKANSVPSIFMQRFRVCVCGWFPKRVQGCFRVHSFGRIRTQRIQSVELQLGGNIRRGVRFRASSATGRIRSPGCETAFAEFGRNFR